MNVTTEEHIRALREALAAGPTPGPWKPHFEEAYFVTGPDLGRVAMMMNLKGAHGLGGRRSGNESAANCRLIAAAHPQAILAVLDALEAARLDAERLRGAAVEVLRWTEAAHRPPVRDATETGRMVGVRLHALADLDAAITNTGA